MFRNDEKKNTTFSWVNCRLRKIQWQYLLHMSRLWFWKNKCVFYTWLPFTNYHWEIEIIEMKKLLCHRYMSFQTQTLTSTDVITADNSKCFNVDIVTWFSRIFKPCIITKKLTRRNTWHKGRDVLNIF